MKSLNNTLLAAIIAIVLTAIVGVLPWEGPTSDEMMKWCYKLHQKYAPRPPDPHLVVATIDENSVQLLGRWPFPRSVHAGFLGVLSNEKPKTVVFDIFFTEESGSNVAPDAQPPANSPPAPDASGSAPAPAPSAPSAPDSPAPPPPSASPAPAPPAQSPSGSTVPNSTVPIAAAQPDATTPAPAAPAAPAPASTAPTQAAPDASAPAASGAPAADASAPAAAPPESDDQMMVDGVSLIPGVVTASQRDPEMAPLNDEDMLPTRPLKNVTGDISQLTYSKSGRIPFPALRKVSYFGFADEDTSSGVRRSVPLVVNINGEIMPSLDLQALMQFWNIDPDHVAVDIGHAITVTKPDGTQLRIPIDAKGEFIINYRGRLEDFQGMSYAAMAVALTDKASNQKSDLIAHLPQIKDNLVVIGVTISGTDAGVTPLEGNTPLVNTHLNVLNNILQDDFVLPVSRWIWMPIYALFLFAVGDLMLRVGIAPMIPIGLLALIFVASVGFGLLWFWNLQVPVAMPEIGILLLSGVVPTKRFWGEEREKIRIRSAMSAYLSEKVMNKVLEHPDNVKLGGVKQEITVMFCDIRGFTKYCDNRDSSEVLDVLNDYMEAMTRVVFKYDGTVDKYIGDCIMAFWNAPELQKDHAQRAVCCAIEMRYALATFKTKRAGKDVELFECGIGIHTGEALVGNMGSSLKRNYTAMGSTVNLGARLESLTKQLNERILISKNTRDLLVGDFPMTDRGETMVSGFAQPVHVYAVGADQDITAALNIGRILAEQQEYSATEVTEPIWQPAPLPDDADPNP